MSRRRRRPTGVPPHVLVAHPSPDVYGSDLQMVSAADGLIARQWQVTVVLPDSGPLDGVLAGRPELATKIESFPVLRRSSLEPFRLLTLLLGAPVALAKIVRCIRAVRPDVVYVNTVTIPWWVVAARIAGVPVVVHVREAEEQWPRVVRLLLTAPLLLASAVVANSHASRRVLLNSVPALGRRTSVIYNGMTGPDEVDAVPAGPPSRLVLVARLSPRKGVDTALEALALLRREGRNVVLDICGTTFAGYEWFEQELRERATQPDVQGSVSFHGYVNPVWDVLSGAHVVLVPSRVEPFGNTAVEGQLSGRPVVASSVQGLTEIVDDDRTGLLVPPDDPTALARAVARLLDEPDLADRLAQQGLHSAHERFAIDRYRQNIHDALSAVIAS